MSAKRARIINKNPLSQTDSVLDSFEQFSKSTRQRVNQPTSQEAEGVEVREQLPAVKQTDSSARKDIEPDSKLASQKANQSTSQKADKLDFKKSTFQLSAEVLQQLDRFHLQLQLELGKANAPYKEVIVEEAIAQLLEQAQRDRAKLIAALEQRQQRRS